MLKPREEIPRSRYIALAVGGLAAIVALWSAVTYSGLVDTLFLPTPTQTLKDGWELFTELGFAGDVAASVWRVVAGFALAAVIGVPLGILVGTFRPFEALISPIVSFVRYMPASAFIPLFIFWIGLNEWEKIGIIFMGSFFSLVLMVAVDAAGVSQDLLDVSYTLGVTPRKVVWRVLLPAAAPAIINTLAMVLGWAWTYIIVAEIVAADKGIGYRIMDSERTLHTGYIIVGIVVIGLIGLISDLSLKWLRRRLFPWVE